MSALDAAEDRRLGGDGDGQVGPGSARVAQQYSTVTTTLHLPGFDTLGFAMDD